MMNREARRILKAEAGGQCKLLARACIAYEPSGAFQRVEDHRAVKALERAFELLLRRGGDPLVMRLDRATAEAFPFSGAGDAPMTARAWLAVGLDIEGRATYSIRWLDTSCYDLAQGEELAERLMLGALGAQTRVRGFPMQMTGGAA